MAKKTTTKPVAKTKAKPTVSKDDPLADLGLDTTTQPTPATEVTARNEAARAAVGADVTNEEVEVGDIELGFIEFIPTAKRTSGGSKYKFDQLVAPKKNAEGKTLYANFTVKLQPGVEPDKLKRSVQSATTQANRQGKDEGKYFVSRSVSKDGVFVGMQVIRTDARPSD